MFDRMLADAADPPCDLAAAAVRALQSAAAVRSAADAMELRSIAELAKLRRAEAVAESARRSDVHRRIDLDLVDRCTAQEVSVALRLSPVVARDRLELALELVDRRPATFAAMRTGAVDLVRARRITDAVRTLPAGSARAVEAEALVPGSVQELADRRPGAAAGELTPAQLTARLARLVLRADPHGAAVRTEVADERRACTLRALPDGMAMLSVTGRGELLSAAFARIDATARTLSSGPAAEPGPAGEGPQAGPAPGTDAARTLDQSRVDVLLALLLGHSSDLSRAAAVDVTVSLVAPIGTVLAGSDEPGELIGYGPVPAPLVRELAADAHWQRWASDPVTGTVVSVGRRRYRPSAAVADLVRARDQRCRFPTCRRAARRCDLDHVVEWPAGDTTEENLLDECRVHHLARHRGGFQVRLAPDGTATWTTPTGEVVIDHPPSWGRPPPGGAAGAGSTTADEDPPEREDDVPPF